jgi:hypothetical protein
MKTKLLILAQLAIGAKLAFGLPGDVYVDVSPDSGGGFDSSHGVSTIVDYSANGQSSKVLYLEGQPVPIYLVNPGAMAFDSSGNL